MEINKEDLIYLFSTYVYFKDEKNSWDYYFYDDKILINKIDTIYIYEFINNKFININRNITTKLDIIENKIFEEKLNKQILIKKLIIVKRKNKIKKIFGE